MKYAVKLLLWKEGLREDNTMPVYIKITVNGKVSYLTTGHYINKTYWDDKTQTIKSGHPHAQQLNPDIQSRKQQIIQKIAEYQVVGKETTAAAIKALFQGKDMTNIFEFALKYMEEVKHKRAAGTLVNYRKHLNKLAKYHGSRELNFEEITHDYLVKYESWLREEEGHGQSNYLYDVWKILKALFNAAKKRGIITNYPFTSYDSPTYTPPDKDYLTMEELADWEEYSLNAVGKMQQQASLYLLLGAYSGLRVSDWYLFDINKNIVGDRIRLRAKKNGGYVSMPISAPLRRVLGRMKDLPLTISEILINRALKAIAAKLGINKKITTHTGRHTFAVTICLGNRISSETSAELMGITLQTFVDNYSQVTDAKIDRETQEAWEALA